MVCAAFCLTACCRSARIPFSAARLVMAVSGPAPKRFRVTQKAPAFSAPFRCSLGTEVGDANQQVYLVTISRVLPGKVSEYRNISELTREQICNMVRDAFDNPLAAPSGAGRPRTALEGRALVQLVVVAKESHEDGSPHFHVVARLGHRMRFKQAKHTLTVRHKIPSHWSCSHSQLWSALRYIAIPTEKKTTIDADAFSWSADGQPVDLVALSQEPFQAVAWRKRRESREAAAVAVGAPTPAFNKLDFMALVLSKHLHTKASLIAYVQDFASPAAQLFTSRNQRRVASFIEDAQEWGGAKKEALAERMTDWGIVCAAAESTCKHMPGKCPYATAAAQIFEHNAAAMSPKRLAVALRLVLSSGPSKTSRVPFLVGPSNTGKSTLLYPFDDLFGPKHVFHKPALGSTFALRNIANRKRFIFWDDFRPIEFAHHNTIPTATFLSLFIGKETEIQVSQSFNDGNLDVAWKRGAVFTAKEDGLWVPTSRVPFEDVRHIRNRVEEFRLVHAMPEGSFKDVESCAPCMAKWIVGMSEEAATGSVPRLMALGDAGNSTSESAEQSAP